MKMEHRRHPARWLLITLGLLTAFVVVPASAEPASVGSLGTGTWTLTGRMQTARVYHTATLLPSGKVLVTGGRNGTGTPLTSAELYEPTTGRWSTTGAMSTARAFHTATLLTSGKVLVTGGQDAVADPIFSSELYDPSTGTWALTGSLNTARASSSATLLSTGQVLVAGGWPHSTDYALSSAELYDPSTGTWTPTDSLNTARAGPAATMLTDGTVLVTSGSECCPYEGFASAELFDPATSSWTYTRSLNVVRAEAQTLLLPDGRVLAIAGNAGICCPWSGGHLASTELYDPIAKAWSFSGSMNVERQLFISMLLPGGKVLVAGGRDQLGGTFASAEIYDPSPGVWRPTSSMQTARILPTATLLLDGSVLVVGGSSWDFGAVYNSAEIYRPSRFLISPTSGMYGQPVTLAGSGFGANESVNIYGDTIVGLPVYTTTTGPAGAFRLTETVRQGTAGQHTLTAVGQTSQARATDTFTIQPRLILNPTTAPAGSLVTASGFGFGAQERVVLTWDKETPARVLGTTTTNTLGSFSGERAVSFTVPADASSGEHVVYAFGQTSRVLAAMRLTVP